MCSPNMSSPIAIATSGSRIVITGSDQPSCPTW
jgi:hypothetical protein